MGNKPGQPLPHSGDHVPEAHDTPAAGNTPGQQAHASPAPAQSPAPAAAAPAPAAAPAAAPEAAAPAPEAEPVPAEKVGEEEEEEELAVPADADPEAHAAPTESAPVPVAAAPAAAAAAQPAAPAPGPGLLLPTARPVEKAKPSRPADSGSSAGCCFGGPPADPTAAKRRRHGANLGSGLTPADFELLKVVGMGSFGKVFQVRKKDTGKIYAMKVLKKEQLLRRKQVAHTQTERKVLEEIDHPFIVSLRFAFQTQEKLYMVLDYFNGGELFFHLKANGRFSEELARFYAAEIVLAIECLHENTIVYRDLKPENVLLDEEGHIRLTDFGLSKDSISGNTLTHTFCGTPEYLAPEIIHGAGYNKAVDWWSLGTLLYEMLTGLPPFFNTNVHVMYEKIMRSTLTFPAYVSPAAQDFLTGLLNRNPQARLGGGPRDAAELKEHPFFACIDWDALMRKDITPPFRPYTKDGVEDVSNVPDEFKKEAPKDTPVNPSALKARVNFPDFSYAAPDAHGVTAAMGGAEGDAHAHAQGGNQEMLG